MLHCYTPHVYLYRLANVLHGEKLAYSAGLLGGLVTPSSIEQIHSLPEHAQEIYKKAHANALEQYQKPEKRRGGKRESAEQVAHKVAWAAVKKKYEKEGDRWVEKAA